MILKEKDNKNNEIARRDNDIEKNTERDGNWTIGVFKGIINYNMKENKNDKKKKIKI